MTQDEEIKAGDTVTWKHGDDNEPKMFVKKIVGSTATCQWFAQNGEFFTLDFDMVDLEVVPQGGAH